MPDELYARYQHYSHSELYAMLMSGSPGQVNDLASIWKSMESTITGLADGLRADLDRLLSGWDSAAGREFDRRVGLVAAYAALLGDEYTAIHNGLSAMAGALAEAQRNAEHPGDPQPNAVEAAFVGVVSALLGRELDPVQRERARSRILTVVCGLAAEYRVIDYGTWPPRVPPPPKDTPAARPDLVVAQSAPTVATTPPAEAPPDAGREHHKHPDFGSAGLPVVTGPPPGVITASTVDQNWPGTGAAIVGAVVAAGAIAAATVLRSRDDALGPEAGADALPGDGVVRSSGPSPSELASGGTGGGASGIAADAGQSTTDGRSQTTTPPAPPGLAPPGAGVGTTAGAPTGAPVTGTGSGSASGVGSGYGGSTGLAGGAGSSIGTSNITSLSGGGPAHGGGAGFDTGGRSWMTEGKVSWGDDSTDPSSSLSTVDETAVDDELS